MPYKDAYLPKVIDSLLRQELACCAFSQIGFLQTINAFKRRLKHCLPRNADGICLLISTYMKQVSRAFSRESVIVNSGLSLHLFFVQRSHQDKKMSNLEICKATSSDEFFSVDVFFIERV